ncbi:PEP-utilizing enzyme [Pseudodesulfovibrio sp.]|nr:PEP-utilizing enzyme [Pseudodesulfovibrio sp.]
MFAHRYDNFRLLIQANTRCHDLMGELEEALRGFTPYGMHYVRTLCTRISTSIFQMVKHLNELDHGSYDELQEVFQEIQERIMEQLEPEEQTEPDRDLVLDLRAVRGEHADLCGPKMAMLGEAGSKLGLRIPDGFVITTESFRRYMKAGGLGEEIDRLIQATDLDDREAAVQLSSRIMQMVIQARLPEELVETIMQAHDSLAERMGGDVKLAVRSSALGEDVEGSAFAGQYRTVLNVDKSMVLSAYKEVIASKYSRQAMAYRVNRGIRDEDVAMSVGCMVMVDARSSGVAYSRNPINIRDDDVSIFSVWGLPKPVVDGTTATDVFVVNREPPLRLVERTIVEKSEEYVCHEKGICKAALLEEYRKEPSLTDAEASRVAREVVRIEDHFGLPQDIEWAMTEDGELHLLQCRPLMLIEDAQGVAHRTEALPKPLISGGRVASPGVGIGPIFHVNKDADTLTFPDGGIMVLKQALPSRAALLDRCSAVITEQGGIAGHLANVAREFGVPALFGVKGVLKAFSDDQIVTVDADGRAVYDGPVDLLLEEKPRRRIMRGSPVQATLSKAARHIVRLNLTDPDSTDFKPRNCKTLHDIMRFCHEMAVREMFQFGTHEEFLQAASRQLVCDVPKQFWVLNLDDGIDPEGEDREDQCVLLEHIDSYPMQMLWEGMQAVPWEGPPPVHTGGLMSVMFEATVNPDLNPAGHSHFTQKNYFMISKNYCSLQSRFGFHFCGCEALVSDRTSENYASFQFKGGAANLERRILRAQFIGEILEDLDFRVRVREDNMFARLEGLDREGMGHRLKILGYLISHTRQLDMVMTSPAEVEKRRAKFLEDFKLFED